MCITPRPQAVIQMGSNTNQILSLHGNIPCDLELETSSSKIAAYCSSSPALLRAVDGIEGVSLSIKLAEGIFNILDHRIIRELKDPALFLAAEKCGEAAALAGLLGCPKAWIKAKESLNSVWSSYSNENSKYRQRKWDKLIRRGCFAIGFTGKGASTALKLVSQKSALLTAAKPFFGRISLLGTLFSLKMSIENFYQIHQIVLIEQGASPEFFTECEETLKQTKRRNLLDLISDICSVVLLGVGLLHVSPLISLGLGISIIILTLWIAVCEERARWELIDCYDEKHIRACVTAS